MRQTFLFSITILVSACSGQPAPSPNTLTYILTNPADVSPEGVSEQEKGELEKLQGAWICMAAESEGKDNPGLKKIDNEILIQGRQILMGGKVKVYYGVDVTKEPKWIDAVRSTSTSALINRIWRGVFSVEVDTLRICYSAWD